MILKRYKSLFKEITITNFKNLKVFRNYSTEVAKDHFLEFLKKAPPTYFDYPEPKIHVPPYERRVIDVWKDEMNHYIDYLKNPKDKFLWRETMPDQFDIIVIGGGFVGSSIAYWLRERHRSHQSILVIDKNLSLPDDNYGCKTPEEIYAALSIGNFRQQFSFDRNIEMAKYSSNFFRNANDYLKEWMDSPIHLPFRPFGFLTLANEKNSEIVKDSHVMQGDYGIENEILTGYQMKLKFPWLNTDDLILGCHGLEGEGWFDPQSLLLGMRNGAMRIGAIFLEAEPAEFVYNEEPMEIMFGFGRNEYRPCNHLTIKLPNGSYESIAFGTCILALGAETGKFAKEFLCLDKNNPGLFSLEIPIERRKRYVFSFEAREGGIPLSSPMIVDPTGLFVKRVGIKDYICGLAPTLEDEPDASNMDVDYGFFYERVWPLLAHRIPHFEEIKLTGGKALYFDYNTYDGMGLLGRHPAYHNLYMAAGFGETGVTLSPAIGRAMGELLYDGCYTNIDFNDFSFGRTLYDIAIHEKMKIH